MDGLEGDGVKRLYYPGIFDAASRVQEYYDKRAKQGDEGGLDHLFAVCNQHGDLFVALGRPSCKHPGEVQQTARIRSFNNCVKTMMLESPLACFSILSIFVTTCWVKPYCKSPR